MSINFTSQETTPQSTPVMAEPRSSAPITLHGTDLDSALADAEFLTREEVLRRRYRRVKQLCQLYKGYYWFLIEDLKSKFREYYWYYGKSPFKEKPKNDDSDIADRSLFVEDNTNIDGDGNYDGNEKLKVGFADSIVSKEILMCAFNRCKSKAMALTKYCHEHILSDPNQRLYKRCSFTGRSKSLRKGSNFCWKPVLRSAVPSLCPLHLPAAENMLLKALRKKGLICSSTHNLAPKFHILVTKYVNQIQAKRRAARKALG